jgi:hypothetical protein
MRIIASILLGKAFVLTIFLQDLQERQYDCSDISPFFLEERKKYATTASFAVIRGSPIVTVPNDLNPEL